MGYRDGLAAVRATVLAASLLVSSGVLAQESLDQVLEGFDEPTQNTDPGLDSVLEGFEESAAEERGPARGGEVPRRWRLSGALGLAAAYGYADREDKTAQADGNRLSRLRSRLDLGVDWKPSDRWDFHADGYAFHDAAYSINGRDEYTEEVLASLENEAELREAYVQGRLSRALDLKFGRQIVVWGKSDNIRVTDILNPLDNREPGMVDIEDLRLPLTMTRLDYYVGDWNLSALAIHEIRFNKNPPFGSDYYPFDAPLPREDVPEESLENTEYALALNGIFSGWDLAVYGARVFDDQPYITGFPTAPERRHARITMLGAATNVAVGSWLLKAEAAHFDGLRFSSLPGEEMQRTDMLVGVEYAGFSDTTLALEWSTRHLHDFSPALATEAEEDERQLAVRYQGDFLHGRLHLTLVGGLFGSGGEDGGFGRAEARYELRDALSLKGGVVAYEGGEQVPFNAIADNDRVFLEVKYSF